jgi:NAD(P)-dependent dehydrogenase (short-subunit alcohol dehydrogenase family)
MLQPGQVTDSLHAYQLAKRGNVLRVMAGVVRWGKRGVRVNTISPVVIVTPLARDEFVLRLYPMNCTSHAWVHPGGAAVGDKFRA